MCAQFNKCKGDMLFRRVPNFPNVCRSFLVLKETTQQHEVSILLESVVLMISYLLWWTSMYSKGELISQLLLSLIYLAMHIEYVRPPFIELVQKS